MFVIAWSQITIDGLCGAPIGALEVGAAWQWHGEAVRVDIADDEFSLADPAGQAALQRHAAQAAKHLVRGVSTWTPVQQRDIDDSPYMGQQFRLTDGRRTFTAMLLDLPASARPLVMFVDCLPPPQSALWVISTPEDLNPRGRVVHDDAKVICFTGATRLRTPTGPVAVEDLREGDRIETRDNGAQVIEWIGHRRMSGARLHAMPELRPVRIRAGALGGRDPDGDLLISPRHRMVLKGALAESLFNTPEVLVTGRDLINDHSILVDRTLHSVDYFHILLPRHEIVWANGVATESFHPAYTDLAAIPGPQRDRLFARRPALRRDPALYGDPARRMLAGPEAAILLGAAQSVH